MLHRSVRRARSRALVGTAAGLVTISGLALAAVAPAHAEPTTKVVLSHTIDLSETRATGHNDFGAEGVRVWTQGSTSTDKAAAYFDVALPLSAAAGDEPVLAWTKNAAQTNNSRPGLQLRTDFDGDGSIDATLVGEPVHADGSPLYGDDWWVPDSAANAQFVKDGAPDSEGGSGSPFHGTLDQWVEEFPDARVIQAGWSLGSGVQGDGVITSFGIGTTTYTFAASPAPATTRLYRNDVVHTDTRPTGHNDFLEDGGVRVWTEGATSTDKATGYFTADVALAEAGEPAMAHAGTSGGRPGLQLVTDFDGDGSPDAILVGEPVYGRDWWVPGGAATQQFVKDGAPRTSGGSGSGFHGLLTEWRAAFPQARILQAGWSLGSGVQGDGVISAITVGPRRFTFTGMNRAPKAGVARVSTPAGVPVTVALPGTDLDGDALTYTSTSGTVTGDELTYPTPAGTAGTAGTEVVEFTVTDGRDSATGVVVVTVTKAAARVVVSTKPGAVTTATRNMRLKAKVASTGVVGAKVRFFDGDRRVGVATIRPDGVAILQAGRLTRGKHVITAVYAGSASTTRAEESLTVRVRQG